MINFTFRKDTKNFNKSYKMGEPKKKKKPRYTFMRLKRKSLPPFDNGK